MLSQENQKLHLFNLDLHCIALLIIIFYRKCIVVYVFCLETVVNSMIKQGKRKRKYKVATRL